MSLKTTGSGLCFLLLAGLLGACALQEEATGTTSSTEVTTEVTTAATTPKQVIHNLVDLPPQAAFGVVCIDRTCSADSEASSDDIFIASFSWSWGDGATTTGGSSASAPSHTYATFGTFTITLTVTDSGGHTASTSKSVTLAPGPNPDFVSSCDSGRTCHFSATLSTGTPPFAFHWDFDDETTTDTTSFSTTHSYSFGATFRVHVTVTDANGRSAGITHNVVVP